MRVSTRTMKTGLRGAAVEVFANRPTMLGVAGVVVASAAFGAALPAAAPPGNQAVYWSSVGDRVPLRHLPQGHLFALLGRELHDSTGSAIGKVAEVLVDQMGRPRAVVVDFGGFLGVGVRKVAVDWHALQFYKAGGRRVLAADIGSDQLARAPQYRPAAKSVAVVSPPNLGYGP
jgi:PRC-barrel domain